MRVRVGRSDWELAFNAASVEEDEMPGGGVRYTWTLTVGQYLRLFPFIKNTYDQPLLVRRGRAREYVKGRLFNNTIQWIE